MPLYEYKCNDCGLKFEELVGKNLPDSSPLCPSCGSANCEKLFSTFALSGGNDSSAVAAAPPCARAGAAGGCGAGSSGRFT